jgi:hypothetical protein
MFTVSHASALFLSMGIGAAVGVLLMLWSAWTLRSGVRRTRRTVAFGVIVVTSLGVPLALAIAMPDFKTALIAWLGYPIGFALSHVLTLPLAHVLARRIERHMQKLR